MHDRRMIAPAEFAADFRKRIFGELACDVHGYLARDHVFLIAFFAFQIRNRNRIQIGDDFLNRVDGNRSGRRTRKDIAQLLLRHFDRNRFLNQFRIARHLRQSRLQIAHVRFDIFCDIVDDVFGNLLIEQF